MAGRLVHFSGRAPAAMRTLIALVLLVSQGAVTPLVAHASPARLAQTQGQPAQDSRFGIVDAYMNPAAARASGAGWERVNFWWNQIQPDNSGQHSAPQTISDAQLQAELSAGMTVVGLLGNPPAWATRNGSTPANLYLPIDDPNNYWAQFVNYMATTYHGRVNSWIIWNEPDIPAGTTGTTWAGTVAEYYQLIKVADEVIKSVDASETVVVAGTTYWIDIVRGDDLWIDRFAATAAADPTAEAAGFYFDAVDMHIYSKAPDVLRISTIYKNVLASHGINKPLWLSETNVAPYDDPQARAHPDAMHETMGEQADFVVEAFAYALAAGFQRMSIFRMTDNGEDTGPWGLLHPDGTPRPAFVAFQTAVKQFSGGSNFVLTDQPYLETLTYDRGASKVTLFWASGQASVQGVVSVIGNQIYRVDRDGNTTPVSFTDAGRQPPVGIDVPASTSHSDSGSPQNTHVGGDPSFVVQNGIGEPIAMPNGSLYFPMTGFTVSTPFASYYTGNGGYASLGDPTGPANPATGGAQEQDFEKVRLLTHPIFANSAYFIESAPVGVPFAAGASYAPFAPVNPPAPSPTAQFFPLTGHSVQGAFLTFYHQNGGLTVFGYPRTEAFQQAGWTVQWFQRARFELHPENAGTPYIVELSLLGSDLTAGRTFVKSAPPKPPATHTPSASPTATPSSTPSVTPSPAATPAPTLSTAPIVTATSIYFPQTGYSVSLGFMQFYKANGGLTVFGYPISNELPELEADGTIRTVQYFQRARFEYHAELAGTPYEVELGLLGDQYLGLK